MRDRIIHKLSYANEDFDRDLQSLLAWSEEVESGVEQTVKEIIAAVRERGDAALLEYTQRFDRFNVSPVEGLLVTPDELESAYTSIDPSLREALEQAAKRIELYHERQKQVSWQYQEEDGTVLGQKITPLDRVGLYVPGGKAAYPSSVLMSAIPAKVAGVREIVMVTPAPDGTTNPAVLAAAKVVGIDRIIRIGGAQAVAALAYGTSLVPKVDKIVGPGNIFVATAKRAVFGQVDIDMIAGPSEILVVADETAKPEWVAMDLCSQAEHDENAQAILVSTSQKTIDAVEQALVQLLKTLERKEIARCSLRNRGALIKVDSHEQAIDVINRVAPEHLELAIQDTEQFVPLIRHAGAIFIGHFSSEALGDYCAGPNHVLPTSGTARFSSPLGVYDFQKRSSIINCSEVGAQKLGKIASVLARSESLEAHALSAELRLEEKKLS